MCELFINLNLFFVQISIAQFAYTKYTDQSLQMFI